jgi:hypothetical protein
MRWSVFVCVGAFSFGTGGCLAPLTPEASTSAAYACDDGRRLEAQFEVREHDMAFGSGTLGDSPIYRVPYETAVVRLDDGAGVSLARTPTRTGFLYRANGYEFRGEGADAVLSTPERTYRCRSGG